MQRLLGVDDTLLSGCFIVDGRIVARGGGAARDTWISAIDLGQSGPIEFVDQAERFLGESVRFPLTGDRSGMFVIASSLDRALAPLRRLQMTIAMVAAGVIVLAVIASKWFARLISDPVNVLVQATDHIARGEFDRPVAIARRDEFGVLGRSINDMADGLK